MGRSDREAYVEGLDPVLGIWENIKKNYLLEETPTGNLVNRISRSLQVDNNTSGFVLI